MTLLNYLMSIRHLVGEFNIEEDHKIKVLVVRSSKPLSDEQKIQVSMLSPIPNIKYVVGSR